AATKQYSSPEEIDIDRAGFQSDLNELQSRKWWYELLVGLAFAVGSALVFWGYFYFFKGKDTPPWELQAFVLSLVGIAVAAGLYGSKQARIASLQSALEILEVRRRAAAAPSLAVSGVQFTGQPASQGQYFDRLVDINVKNLGDYYGLVRLHNDK